MYSCDDLFDLAIQIEKNGERTLRKAQEKISNPKLIPLLKWLADEEVEHAQWLLQLKSAKQKPIENPELEAFGKSLLRDVLGEQSFSLADADFTKIKKAHQLLSLMIEFENDLTLFYEMIRSVISDKEALECVDKIIDAENRHVKELQAFINMEVQS